jgi:hypothetical protein
MIAKLSNKTEEELDFIINEAKQCLQGLSDAVKSVESKIQYLLNIIIAGNYSLLGIVIFQINELNFIILLCSIVIIIGSILCIHSLFKAIKTEKYYSIGTEPSTFLNMENDPFYENLIGKKAGLCIYLQERIQENIEKN